ncbi:MAG: BrnA antitoxin family protein [Gammaproteobacteria bacterium]
MNAKSKGSRRTWRDRDDAPELTQEWIDRASVYHGKKLVRRGRPPAEIRKVSTTLRLSPEVIEHFRAGGPGWQTRIDEALKRVVARAGASIARRG